MPDEFDRFLSSALAPSERLPDRQFVARVQARIALEERLEAQRRSMLGGMAKQLLALLTVAAGVWWVGRSAAVSSWFAESPAAAVAILLAGFMFVAAVLSGGSGSGERSESPL